jgi:hypothetical protein
MEVQPSDLERLNTIAKDLLHEWRAQPDAAGTFTMKRRQNRRTTEPQFLATFALCAHVYELADIAIDLLARGRSTAATPIVRSIYESALTAHWIAQAEDGAEAFVREDVRQRKAMQETLRTAMSSAFREGPNTSPM